MWSDKYLANPSARQAKLVGVILQAPIGSEYVNEDY